MHTPSVSPSASAGSRVRPEPMFRLSFPGATSASRSQVQLGNESCQYQLKNEEGEYVVKPLRGRP